VLYETDERALVEAGNLTAEEYRLIAEKHFGQWFDSASSFLVTFQSVFERGDYKRAAFQLHQATEHFYACLLL